MSPMSAEDRMSAAEVRAVADSRRARILAEELVDEIDETTDPGVRVPVEIHEEDSAVHAIEGAATASRMVANGTRR